MDLIDESLYEKVYNSRMGMFSPFYTWYILYMVAVCDRLSRSSIKFTLFVTEAIKNYKMTDFKGAHSEC